ncbi:hypothetical protein BJV82DRAFT_581062 [Fennellomyces sp. T-0311]|nr:hypothetical protein BJV82DRAFT_581062 [Fennellomyces sp. T-0311]
MILPFVAFLASVLSLFGDGNSIVSNSCIFGIVMGKVCPMWGATAWCIGISEVPSSSLHTVTTRFIKRRWRIANARSQFAKHNSHVPRIQALCATDRLSWTSVRFIIRKRSVVEIRCAAFKLKALCYFIS